MFDVAGLQTASLEDRFRQVLRRRLQESRLAYDYVRLYAAEAKQLRRLGSLEGKNFISLLKQKLHSLLNFMKSSWKDLVLVSLNDHLIQRIV